MERQLKKQIDDLLDYTMCLKNMFTRLAQSEAFPDEMADEDKKEINDILNVMNAALEIETKKISKIHISTSDLDSMEAYLLKYREFTSYEDFVYEDNELERLRVYNKLYHKYLTERNIQGYCSIDELIGNSFSKVIDSNFVYVLNLHMKNPEVANLYGFLKYGKIFISPTYDREYFPSLQVSELKPITYYPILAGVDQDKVLIKYGLEEIKKEFTSIIDTLYDGFSNDTLEIDENEVRVIAMGMAMVSYLSTSLDTNFIDERYIEFNRRKKEDKDYTDVNDMILSSLIESKKIVLKQQEKRN